MNSEDLIYSYSRAQAIEDGLQVCVSDLFPNDTRMYNYPVYFTQSVWKLCQGKGAIIWDICYMAVAASKVHKSDSSIIKFGAIVRGASRKPDFFEDTYPIYYLLAECSAKDINDPTPVITFMVPEER